MSFMELVRARESVRRYADRAVPREAVERCLEAARLAPSACNSQPWRFHVMDAEPLRSRVAAAAFSGIYTMNRFAERAPVLVAVETERSRFAAALGGRYRGVSYAWIDVGIACEHFVLQAAEEGLGTCWLGWFDAARVKRLLDLPRRARLDIMLSLGYPVVGESREKKRRSATDIARYHGG